MFHGEERRGFVTSAHPVNHHFQGHAKMEMTFLKRPAMAAFLIPGLVGVTFWHSMWLFLFKIRRQYGINTSSDRENPG